ncbi:MAG: sialidase family protein [Acidimicrobiales bacterium]
MFAVLCVVGVGAWLEFGHPRGPGVDRARSGGRSRPAPNATSYASGSGVLGGQSLSSITPIGAKVLWAWTQNQSALTGGGQDIEFTTNGGRTWNNATPTGLSVEGGAHWINGFFALSSTRAWLVYGRVDKNPQYLETTSDAGRHWSKVGVLPRHYCTLQFVTPLDGTCTVYAGAAGSMGITIYRTSDGGAHWSNLFDSYMTPASLNEPTPPGGLPFSCDKSISFTSATTGWALFLCAGGFSPIYESTNGGATWVQRNALPPSPLPSGGSGFSGTPVFSGAHGAVAYTYGSYSLVYVSDNAGRTFRPVYPPGKRRPWSVALLSPREWRLAYKDSILGTDNAGQSWFVVTSDANQVVPPERYASPAPDVLFAKTSLAWLIENNVLLRTVNEGQSWKTIAVPGTQEAK